MILKAVSLVEESKSPDILETPGDFDLREVRYVQAEPFFWRTST